MFNYNTVYNDPTISAVPSITNPHVLGLPQDAVDPVAVSTANPSWEAVGNAAHFLMRSLANYRTHVAIQSWDGLSVVIEKFGITYALDAPDVKYVPNYTTGRVTITPAGLVANTWYYIYMILNTGFLSNPSFNSIIVLPDQALMWRSGDPSQRYIGSFLTDGAAKITPFEMRDYDYTFAVPQDTNYSAVDFNGPGPADVIFSNIPPYAKTVKVLIRGALPGGATGTLFFTLAPKEVAAVTTANWPGFVINPIQCGGDFNSVVTPQTFYSEYPLFFPSQRLSMAVQPIVVAARNRVWWTGFKE